MPVVRTDGRSGIGVWSRDYQIFSDGLVYFLTHGAPLARFARYSSAMNRECLETQVTTCILKMHARESAIVSVIDNRIS